MNTAEKCFKVATRADKWGNVVFYIVLIVSALLAAFPKPQIEEVGHPCLIVAAVFAIVCTVLTTFYQTDGNRAMRSTQLSDALGAASGDAIRADYYNNTLPKSLRRLAATTLENTLFTKEILSQMAVTLRIKTIAFLVPRCL
jgi:hypothetical protein